LASQRDFHSGRSTTEQIFEKPREYVKDVYTCFVSTEEAYDRVLREKLLGVLWEYGADGRVLLAVKSLYMPAQKFLTVWAGLPD